MRERILAAAAAQLVDTGTQTSMAAIATRAGVATGSLYNYFESKDVLVRAVYDDLSDQFDALWNDDRINSGPALKRLENYIEKYIDFFWEDRDRAILFEYLSSVPLIPHEEMTASFARTSAYIAGILEALRDDGWLAPGDPQIMGAFIGGAIRNALKWRRVLDKPLTEANRRQIRDMCLVALRGPEGRPGCDAPGMTLQE